MGHRVTIQNSRALRGHMTESEIRDFIDMFYRWDDAEFHVIIHDTAGGATRGRHQFCGLGRIHTIELWPRLIEKFVGTQERCGGNHPAPTVKMAYAMVFAHELQHANQARVHHGVQNSAFYARQPFKRYLTRPAEVDARLFVDEHMDVIASFLGEKVAVKRTYIRDTSAPAKDKLHQELEDIADSFEGVSEVTVKDIVEELRNSRVNSVKNVEMITSILENRGTKVTY